jgi:hypothetical protein
MKQIHQKDVMLKNSLLGGREAQRTGKWWEIKGLTTVIQAAIKNPHFSYIFAFSRQQSCLPKA